MAALFAAALLAFTRPFIALYAGDRIGEGTGFELARGNPSLSGAYDDPSLRGQVESRFRDAELPALLALAGTAFGLALVWLPRRLGPGLALLAGLGALGGLAGILAVTASPYVAAATDRRYGIWFTAMALGAATVCAGILALLTRRAPRGHPA